MKWANEAIEDDTLRDVINKEVEMMSSVTAPSLDGFTKADISGTTVSMGGTTVTLSPKHGAIIGLLDARGVQWASAINPLGLFSYTLYTNDQMTDFRTEYCPNGCNPKEFGKPGMPLNK